MGEAAPSALDRLLDLAWDYGATVRWGRHTHHRYAQQPDTRCWVSFTFPDRTVEQQAKSYESAAWQIMASEFPDPDDQPEDIA